MLIRNSGLFYWFCVTYLTVLVGSSSHNVIINNASLANCLNNIKCPHIDAPFCLSVKKHKNNPVYIIALNKCEMRYLKCYSDLHAVIEPMSSCERKNKPSIAKNSSKSVSAARNRVRRHVKLAKKSPRKGIKKEKQKVRVIQFSASKQITENMKNLKEWSPYSIEQVEDKLHIGFVVEMSRYMEEAMSYVRNCINTVLYMMSSSNSKRITDLVLSVYVWPDKMGNLMTRTDDAEEFMVAVSDLSCMCQNENECPKQCEQNIYQATILGLDRAMPKSHIFVFANGPPMDSDLDYWSEVHRLAKEKKIEITFVMTGDCDAYKEEPFQSFYPLAADTNGQVMRLDKQLLKDQFVQYVNHTVMEYEKRVVVSKVYPVSFYKRNRIIFDIAPADIFVTVTVSGDKVDCVVRNYRNTTLDWTHHIKTPHVKMYKYVVLPPGQYAVQLLPDLDLDSKLKHPTLVTIAVSGIELLFKFGFCDVATDTLKNTDANPLVDNLYYMIIAVREPRRLLKIKTVSLMHPQREQEISKYKLESTKNEDVYRTKYKIAIPKFKKMRVMLTGIIPYKTKEIKKISDRFVIPYKRGEPTTSTTTRRTTTPTSTTTSTSSTTTTTTTESSGSESDTTTTESSGSESDTTTTTESSGSDSDTTTTNVSSGSESDTTTTTESSGSESDTTTTTESSGSESDTTTTTESSGSESDTTTESSGSESDTTTTESSGSVSDTTTTTESSGSESDTTTTTESSVSESDTTTTESSGSETDTTATTESSGSESDTTTTTESSGSESNTTTTSTESAGSESDTTTTTESSGSESDTTSSTESFGSEYDFNTVPGIKNISIPTTETVITFPDNIVTTTRNPLSPNIDKNHKNHKCVMLPTKSGADPIFKCRMRCKVNARDKAKINWSYEPKGDKYNSDVKLASSKITWKFHKYKGGYIAQTFTCHATNKYGEDTYSVHVYHKDFDKYGYMVLGDPPKLMSVAEGEEVKIDCGGKSKKVEWWFKQSSNSKNRNFQLLDDNKRKLVLKNVEAADEGQYKCVPKSGTDTEPRIIDLKVVAWQQFTGLCPAQCPVRDVMACARCEHGVHRTFMSICHIRMYQCKHPDERLELVARRPCTASAPHLGDLPLPETDLAEPGGEDPLMDFLHW